MYGQTGKHFCRYYEVVSYIKKTKNKHAQQSVPPILEVVTKM